jgi:hypothetical protein
MAIEVEAETLTIRQFRRRWSRCVPLERLRWPEMRQAKGTVCADPASGTEKRSQRPVSSAKKPLAPGSAEKMSNFHRAVVEGGGELLEWRALRVWISSRLNPSGKCRCI